MDLGELKSFIFQASRNTYASEDSSIREKQIDNSTTIKYADGEWRYHDNYFGGEPYGGREVVFYKDQPVWIMVYYGSVLENSNTNEIYGILTEALRSNTINEPYRGPRELVTGEFRYVNELNGSVDDFNGEEKIYKGDTLLYSARYMGGLVDKR